MVRSGVAALCLLAACGDSATTTALFTLAAPADDFYALPFPNDVYRRDDGTLDLQRVPANGTIVPQIRDAAGALDGFGLNQAMFARFDGTLEPDSLPDPAGSLHDAAAVYLVDVDPDSADRGQRIPIVVRFRSDPGETIGDNSVVARPFPGFGLTEATTYALVITKRVHDTGGRAIGASETFATLLGQGGDATIRSARARYQPLLDWLDQPGGDDRDDIASAAVFTTQRFTHVVAGIRSAVLALPAPTASNVESTANNTVYGVYVGSYIAPNFQTGEVPYSNAPSGEIRIDAGGAAIVERMEPMRFALTVPSGPVPTGGFPIAICQHGTGSTYTSFITDGTAQALAEEGIATIATDQVLHGPRNPGGNPEIAFFNIANIYAARDNSLQGAADGFSLLRLAQGLSIPDGGRTITFDPSRVYFFGHSQGGLTGPGFVAFEPSVSGAVLSGTGGLLYLNLLHKTLPVDISSLVPSLLDDSPVDEDNPSLALAQMWIERADGANYAPLMARRPLAGLAPRNVLQTEGFTDRYAPNIGIEAFATALGADLIANPDAQPVEGLTLRGRSTLALPVTGNLTGATIALAQFAQLPDSDGHFVVFDVPAARRQAAAFLGTLARTGQATVVAP
ncbi:MAG: hypothetical protein AB7O24_12125 [Kofleriaceae bacterium]